MRRRRWREGGSAPSYVPRTLRNMECCAADPGSMLPWVPALRSSAVALHRVRDTPGASSILLSRRLLAGLIDCHMMAMGERGCAIADDQRIELDEAMALFLVIGDDFGARGQFIADPSGAQQLHPASDVNPGAENDVVNQHLVHDPLQQAGMAEPFARIDRIALANIGTIFGRGFASPCARYRTQPLAGFEGRRAHRLALRDWRDFRIIGDRESWCCRWQRNRSARTKLAATFRSE